MSVSDHHGLRPASQQYAQRQSDRPSRSEVAGVQVTVTNLAQGTSRETQTNAEGLYVFPSLEVGKYDLRVESPTFATTETHGLILAAGATQTVDIGLHAAGAKETINVAGDNQAADLTQSIIQGQITSQTISAIPLNGRNLLELAYLLPGNRPEPTFDPTKTNTLEVSSAGGIRGTSNNNYRDAISPSAPFSRRRTVSPHRQSSQTFTPQLQPQVDSSAPAAQRAFQLAARLTF
ncbi:carboxypeptidase-like regulatory domain-containing protein [Tunturiibacter lichenicola]|uniref:carboxypeptidase-like regulatory domain-containing protein n=1 Tax=Tunturiibacter lichenicola TaxID=2051959 RepID=UPI003D9BAE3B